MEVHPTAGKILPPLSSEQQEKDSDGDILMKNGQASGPFSSFSSELDWKIAEWAVKDSIGHTSLDHLLAIPEVRSLIISSSFLIFIVLGCRKTRLSYHNTRTLHKTVDAMPDRAGDWMTRTLAFNDRPDDKYTIRYRNPIDTIKSIWEDPAHTEHLVFSMKKIFSDSSRENRIFNEIWTGKWWHSVQVKDTLTFSIDFLLIVI